MAAEIISTVERRRSWPDEVKLRIMTEALEPGATVAAVADRNGVCRSLLYTWLRQVRENRLPGISMRAEPAAGFVPVRIEAPVAAPPACPSTAPRSLPPRRRTTSLVEITLANGRSLKVDEGIDPSTLARLVAALDDGARLQDGGRT